jgi:hypothetical protein
MLSSADGVPGATGTRIDSHPSGRREIDPGEDLEVEE